MKQFIAGVVAGALATGGVGLAATAVEHNGAFWRQLSAPAKVSYVAGYRDAMNVSVGKLDDLKIAADIFHWRGAKKILGQIDHELSDGGLTSDAAVRQLDSLYANPKYAELDLGQALEFLAVRVPDGNGAASPTTPAVTAKSPGAVPAQLK